MTSRAVILLRHGKSDRLARAADDLGRPLARRGRTSAAAVGRFLAATDQIPDLVLCSPATRARETVEGAVDAGRWTCPVEACQDLYFGSLETIVQVIRGTPAQVTATMLVGHEPTTSSLIHLFVGGGDHRVPTAALARVAFDTDRWDEIGAGRGRLEWLVPSRLLVAAGY